MLIQAKLKSPLKNSTFLHSYFKVMGGQLLLQIRKKYYQCRYFLRAILDLGKNLLDMNNFFSNQELKKFTLQRWGLALLQDKKFHLKEDGAIWIDALGGGEVCQISTFVQKIRELYPDRKIVLSTHHKEMLSFIRQRKDIDFVFSAPHELAFSVKRVMKVIKPSILVVVDLVFFPFILEYVKKQGVPVVVVGAHLWDGYCDAIHMKRTKMWQFHKYVDAIGCAGLRDKKNFESMGTPSSKIHITGSMKYDMVHLYVSEEKKNLLRQSLGLGVDDYIFVAGSIRKGEERILIKAFLRVKGRMPNFKLVLVPRFFRDLPAMEAELNRLGAPWCKKTNLMQRKQGAEDIVVVDTFGELAHLYAIASVVLIGNSLVCDESTPLGQNIIEPLVQLKPIFFGPFIDKWRPVMDDFKKIWHGLEVQNEIELGDGIVYLFRHPEIIQEIMKKSKKMIDENEDNITQNVLLVAHALSQSYLS